MSECVNHKCPCNRTCFVLDQCLFTHPLAVGYEFHLTALLDGNMNENDRTRRVLHFFYEQQPPKWPVKNKIFPIKGKYRRDGNGRIHLASELIVPTTGESLTEYIARVINQPVNNFHE